MFKTFEISKGINLHYLEEQRFKTITTAIFIRNTLRKEDATKTALAAECLRGGCKKYPSMRQLAVKLEEMWGIAYEVAVIKRGDEQAIYVYLEGLTKTFYESMDFVKDMFFEPNLTSERFIKSSKERLKQSIVAVKDRKSEYAIEQMASKLSEGNDPAFGIPSLGYAEDVDKISDEDIRIHWEKLISQNPIDIFVVGKENPIKIVEKLKEVFSKKRTQYVHTGTKVFKRETKQTLNITEEENINQARLVVAFSFSEAEEKESIIPLLLLSEILGGGSSSKLFNIVREQESLCYSINSFLFKQKRLLVVQAGIEANAFQKVTSIIEDEVEKISSSITEEDLEEGKRTLKKAYDAYEDIPADRINFAFSMWISNLEMDIEEFKNVIDKATLKDIKELAQKGKNEIKYLLK